MTAGHLAYLIRRSLATEAEVASVDKAHTVYRDRIGLSVVDTDGARWRLHIMREPWARPGTLVTDVR